MRCFVWFTLLSTSAAAASQSTRFAVNNDMVTRINSLDTTWKAGENEFFKGMPLEHAKKLMGTKLKRGLNAKYLHQKFENDGPIPEAFDAREKWPECNSITQIRDQSNCGSCWAIAAAEAISDRICIATKGKRRPTISTADLLACCGPQCGFGCRGGNPYDAWVYWVNHGLVTGGLYNSSSGCQPYPFPPCSHHINGTYPPCGKVRKTPTCAKKCIETYTAQDYDSDKYYGSAAYLVAFGEHGIQRDLMKHGPLEATIAVYADFLTYKSGVYQHKLGDHLGYHAVRLLGWGVEQNTPYWLLANSWNTEWGEKGYFKLIRGNDNAFEECTGGLFGSAL